MQIKEHSYSLIIPTRNRQRTAMYAIESALNCNYENLQIVIPDNSDTDELYHLLKYRGWLEKVTYHKNEKTLSMRDNWERGIDLATGEILSVIGDDDAIMPDAHTYANVLFSRHDIQVLHSESAIYKWDCYPLPGRRHYIRANLRESVQLVNNPRDLLRRAINYDTKVGTGPGLYYGFVKKTFLEKLRKTRGRWIVDHIPDFDSGYATLMYADSFALISRPLFIQGHSGKSNSGGMRVTSNRLESYTNYLQELNSPDESPLLGKLASIQNTTAIIVAAQFRIIKEIQKSLKDNKAKINKERAWDDIANGFKTDYDIVGFLACSAELQKLRNAWKEKSTSKNLNLQFPSNKNLSALYDQGPKNIEQLATKKPIRNAENNPRIKTPALVINGQKANIKNINDAINLLQGVLSSPINASDKDLKIYAETRLKNIHQIKLEDSIKHIDSKDYTTAENLIISVLSEDSNNINALRALAITYEKMGNIKECPPLYARAFTLTLELNDLEDYFRTLITSGSPQTVIEQIEQLCQSDPSLALNKNITLLLQEATIKLMK